MRRPRVYIIAAEQLPDGTPTSLLSRDTYESVTEMLGKKGCEGVWPNHDTEGGDEPDMKSIIIERASDMSKCEIAVLVPGWQDCPKARKLQQTATLNRMSLHSILDGYEKIQETAFNRFYHRA